MCQPLPLPERIPFPRGEKQKQQLFDMGITWDSEGEDKYVTYTLPNGWQMINATTFRNDLPKWYIVDSEMRKRVCISGSWKGTYNNDLNMDVYKEPGEILVIKDRNPQPSETDDVAILHKVIKAAQSQEQVSSRSPPLEK